MTTELRPIPYCEPARYCGECFNKILEEVTARPMQDMCSIFCTHGSGALVTARIGDHKGARCVHSWSVTGPLTQQQAREAVEHLARTGLVSSVIGLGPPRKTIN